MNSLSNPLLDVDVTRLDVVAWALVVLFFGACALVFGGHVQQAVLQALAIVGLMLVIAHSIELILKALNRNPNLGEITGYITNGPEALVLLVGLIHQKLNLAMGVPLGSNFANPILMVIAAGLTGSMVFMAQQNPLRTGGVLIMTMLIAGSFWFLNQQEMSGLWLWAGITLVVSVWLYFNKGSETDVLGGEADDELPESIAGWYVIPAAILLVVAGYFLDPVVSGAAKASRVPEGVISFVVLSFMTSWPEFRAALALFGRHQPGAAVMNIMVSNLTNLWLAVLGVILFGLSQLG